MDRPITAVLPRQFQFWPEDKIVSTPDEIREMYEMGYAGAWQDEEAAQNFQSAVEQFGGTLDGASIAAANKLEGSGEGRLILPYRFVEKHYPGAFPGAAQQRGDCVSHSTTKAGLLTMVCDVESGQADEVSGRLEACPTVSLIGIKNGVVSSEANYWWRGYNSDGWSCEASAQVALEKAALWLRQDYPELGIDLTKYSGSMAGKYGRTPPPSNIREAGKDHLMRTATKLSGSNKRELLRDYLANGYGVSTCGGEGYSKRRDENGYSPRSGSWSHAFPAWGFDDRPIIKDKYGESLVLAGNNWGVWNGGGTRILGTDIDIPPGFWWTKWSEFKNRSLIALSGANGWAARKLPSFEFIVG